MSRLAAAALAAVLVLVAGTALATNGRPEGATPGPLVARSAPDPGPQPASDRDDPGTAPAAPAEAPTAEDLDDGRPPGASPGPITASGAPPVTPEPDVEDDTDDPSAAGIGAAEEPPAAVTLEDGR
jgi:hypothetical protein